MQIKYILNQIQKHKGFIYGQARLLKKARRMVMEIDIQPRKNSLPICSGCQKKGPGYDTQSVRRYEFVPLWGIALFFLYARRRVDCPGCGIKVEQLPWAEGKQHLTKTFAWFLASWARRLSWKETAEAFQTSWDQVFRSVKMAVAWGLAQRDLNNIAAIGIDEIAWSKGPKYLTMVYQIDAGCRRLLWIGRERTQKTLRTFFEEFGPEATSQLRFICSDMWKPYLRVVAEKAGQALHILDRFHIMSKVGKAIDKVRAQEVKKIKARGETPVLTHSRWCFLKRPENLTDKQAVKLKDLLSLNLRTVRAYLLKEDLQRFWTYNTPGWAGRFLDDWCTRTMRSRIPPMKKIARMLRNHRPLLLNWFRVKDRVALGAVEGFNNKAKLVTKKAYGFRNYEVIKIALYHTLGKLSHPKGTHRFC